MNVYTHMNYERASAQMFELVDGRPKPTSAVKHFFLSEAKLSCKLSFEAVKRLLIKLALRAAKRSLSE